MGAGLGKARKPRMGDGLRKARKPIQESSSFSTATTEDRGSENVQREWAKMPPELLSTISDYLPLVDYMSFRRVCKGWRSAPFRRSEIANFSRDEPWLLFYGLDDKDDTCYFYSKSHPKCCTLKLPGLRGATCVYSRLGWILARRGMRFFFYNPFSMEKIELPAEYPHKDAAEQVYAFEPRGPSPNFVAFVISRREESVLEVSSCQFGRNKEWVTEKINVGRSEFGTLTFAFVKNRCVHIYDKSSILSYYISIKRWWIFTQRPPVTLFFFRDTRAVHQDDWLFKFGKRGFSLSVCALHTVKLHLHRKICGLSPFTCMIDIASGTRKEEAGLKNAKAVWTQVEPKRRAAWI